MRDVDLDTLKDIEQLWTEDAPTPNPARRTTARARSLNAFEKTHRRGIGAAVARHFVRSSAPIWRRISETLDSPWTETFMRLATSLLALIIFTVALISIFMVTG